MPTNASTTGSRAQDQALAMVETSVVTEAEARSVGVPEQGTGATEPRAETPSAVLRFLSGWVTKKSGELQRGRRLSVQYDPDRLPSLRATYNGMATWGIDANARFHPGGQFTTGGLLQFIHGDPPQPLEQPRPLAYELDIPQDATRLELWFKNSDRSGRTEWDSRFGENYRFDVGPPLPTPSVSYRTGAITSVDTVNVSSDAATKVDAFPRG